MTPRFGPSTSRSRSTTSDSKALSPCFDRTGSARGKHNIRVKHCQTCSRQADFMGSQATRLSIAVAAACFQDRGFTAHRWSISAVCAYARRKLQGARPRVSINRFGLDAIRSNRQFSWACRTATCLLDADRRRRNLFGLQACSAHPDVDALYASSLLHGRRPIAEHHIRLTSFEGPPYIPRS